MQVHSNSEIVLVFASFSAVDSTRQIAVFNNVDFVCLFSPKSVILFRVFPIQNCNMMCTIEIGKRSGLSNRCWRKN